MESLCGGVPDVLNHFPAYVGWANLARTLAIYDLYKRVQDLNGHIADIGTFRGASFLLFAKLVKLMEPHDTTVVHGFDWFQGMAPGKKDYERHKGDYVGDYEQLVRLTELQGLSEVAHLHKMDLTRELPAFFAKNDYMRFKIVFLDCGIREVLEESLKHFWPRLVNGGILLFDHYNTHVSPSESLLFDQYAEGRKVHTVPFCRQPTGFIVK
jgi:hypothetical protein